MDQEKTNITSENKGCTLNGTIELTLKFDSAKLAQIIYRSLHPEVKNPPTYRSKINIEINNATLKITIYSRDIVSMRASTNSFLRWIYVIINTISLLEVKKDGSTR